MGASAGDTGKGFLTGVIEGREDAGREVNHKLLLCCAHHLRGISCQVGVFFLLLPTLDCAAVTCVGVPNWSVFDQLKTDQTYSCVYVLLNFTQGYSTQSRLVESFRGLYKYILCKSNVCRSVCACYECMCIGILVSSYKLVAIWDIEPSQCV